MIRSKLWRCVILALIPLATGCGVLDVSDPTVVEESDISNPDGAELLRRHAVVTLFEAHSYGARNSGLLADELVAFPSQSALLNGTIWNEHVMDLRGREPLLQNWASTGGDPYRWYQLTRVAASHAIEWYRDYGVESQHPHLGQMLAVRGFAVVGLAEQVCPGFALHGVEEQRPNYTGPLTTNEAFEHALTDLDSAVVYAADSARFLHFAQVVRARALLGLGRFAEAAAAVQGVPTEFVWNGEYSGFSPGPTNWFYRIRYSSHPLAHNLSVADNEGGNGLDFISAGDPRVQVTLGGPAHDGVSTIYTLAQYPVHDSPIVIANGIEARLIEAEAALDAGDPSWLTILNELRATQVTPALPDTTDPGTDAARVDLLFRERAFWLFTTGHRLGDLRRLIQHYGRDAEAVFPSGAYHLGGSYEGATSLPFVPVGEERASTGVIGCTD